MQKKTFTKWVNSHLARVTCRISDLYMDLRDGRVLIKLLEVLSGELLVGILCRWRPQGPSHPIPCPIKLVDLGFDQHSITSVVVTSTQGCPWVGNGVPSTEGRVLSSVMSQPKPTKGRMRIHCLENVDKALQFLKEQRVHLENMGSHDIVDGNHRLVLGLIWTIILRFQVRHISTQHPTNHS